MKESTITTILEILDNETKLATDAVFACSRNNDNDNARLNFNRLMKAIDAKKDLQRYKDISDITVPNLDKPIVMPIALLK